MSRCEDDRSAGVGFWLVAALAVAYIVVSVEPTPSIELAAGPVITASPTTAPMHTHQVPTSTTTALPAGQPADGGGGAWGDDDSPGFADSARRFAECMSSRPFGPVYCAVSS